MNFGQCLYKYLKNTSGCTINVLYPYNKDAASLEMKINCRLEYGSLSYLPNSIDAHKYPLEQICSVRTSTIFITVRID